jgi:ATP-dependent Zn protease
MNILTNDGDILCFERVKGGFLHMKEGKSPQKPLMYYLLIVMIVLTLLNTFVFPAMSNMRVIEVGYDQFRSMVENGKVKQVEVNEEYIMFLAEAETMKGDIREVICKTGLMDDPGLNDRLYAAGVAYGKLIPTEGSPVLSFLMTWILPFVLFMGLGRLLKNGDPALKGLEVKAVKADDSSIYKYVYGNYKTLSEAKNQLPTVRKKFPEAFVVKVSGNTVARTK